MQATTTLFATAHCPTWCVATHYEGTDHHLQTDTDLQDMDRRPFAISRFHNSTTGRTGVYLGDLELSPAMARHVAGLLLAAADLDCRAGVTR